MYERIHQNEADDKLEFYDSSKKNQKNNFGAPFSSNVNLNFKQLIDTLNAYKHSHLMKVIVSRK